MQRYKHTSISLVIDKRIISVCLLTGPINERVMSHIAITETAGI